MLVKRSARALALLLGLPSAAFALGLGDIHLLSPLNAPLDAEIELVDVAPDELATMQVQLASRDTFSRYGLEWPAYLSTVQLKTVRTPDGRQVVKLKSTDPIAEPFVTLLVEVNWARGRLVREYTMLLDPPVYTPGESAVASAPVAPAATGPGAREGSIARATEAPPPPAPAPAEAPSTAAAPATATAAPPPAHASRAPAAAPAATSSPAGNEEGTSCRAARRDALADRQRRGRRRREFPAGPQLDARHLSGEPESLPPEHERAALGRSAAYSRCFRGRGGFSRRGLCRNPPPVRGMALHAGADGGDRKARAPEAGHALRVRARRGEYRAAGPRRECRTQGRHGGRAAGRAGRRAGKRDQAAAGAEESGARAHAGPGGRQAGHARARRRGDPAARGDRTGARAGTCGGPAGGQHRTAPDRAGSGGGGHAGTPAARTGQENPGEGTAQWRLLPRHAPWLVVGARAPGARRAGILRRAHRAFAPQQRVRRFPGSPGRRRCRCRRAGRDERHAQLLRT